MMGRATRSGVSGGGKLPSGGSEQNGAITTNGKVGHVNGVVHSSHETPNTTAFEFSKEVNFEYKPRQNGFGTVLEFMKRGNEGVKEKMLNECNFIVECRVCNNLFRSPRDFVSHKDKHCTEKYQHVSPAGLAELLRLAQSSFKINTETVVPNSIVSILPTLGDDDSSNTERDLSFDVNHLVPMMSVALNRRHSIEKPSPHLKPKELELLTNTSSQGADGITRTSRQLHRGPNGVVKVTGKYKSMQKDNAAVIGADSKTAAVGKPSTIQIIVDKLAAQWESRRTEEDFKESSLKCVICKMLCPSEKALRIHSRQDHLTTSGKGEKRRPAQLINNGITKEIKVMLIDERNQTMIKSEGDQGFVSTSGSITPSRIHRRPKDISQLQSTELNGKKDLSPTKDVPRNKQRLKSKVVQTPLRVSSFRRLTNNSFSATLGSSAETPRIPTLEESEHPVLTSPPKKLKKELKQVNAAPTEGDSEVLDYKAIAKAILGNPKKANEPKRKKVSNSPRLGSTVSFPKKIVCLKCTATFSTEMEMSVHIGNCSIQNSASRISILDRHDYLKPSRDELQLSQTQQSSDAPMPTLKQRPNLPSFNNNENEVLDDHVKRSSAEVCGEELVDSGASTPNSISGADLPWMLKESSLASHETPPDTEQMPQVKQERIISEPIQIQTVLLKEENMEKPTAPIPFETISKQ